MKHIAADIIVGIAILQFLLKTVSRLKNMTELPAESAMPDVDVGLLNSLGRMNSLTPSSLTGFELSMSLNVDMTVSVEQR